MSANCKLAGRSGPALMPNTGEQRKACAETWQPHETTCTYLSCAEGPAIEACDWLVDSYAYADCLKVMTMHANAQVSCCSMLHSLSVLAGSAAHMPSQPDGTPRLQEGSVSWGRDTNPICLLCCCMQGQCQKMHQETGTAREALTQ